MFRVLCRPARGEVRTVSAVMSGGSAEHIERGLCLVVMCQFITFCDSVSSLLPAFPLLVQLLSSIEGNVGYTNRRVSVRRRLQDTLCSNISRLKNCRGKKREARWEFGSKASWFINSLTRRWFYFPVGFAITKVLYRLTLLSSCSHFQSFK